MRRRHLVAVLLVLGLVLPAGVVLAGLGDTGSGAPEASLTPGHPHRGGHGVTVSVAKLMARQHAYDRRTAGRPFVIRVKPEPDVQPAVAASQLAEGPNVRQKPEPGESGQPKRNGPAARQQRIGSAATTPASSFSAGTSFLGAQVSESQFVPPDSMGSVGPDQIVVDVNGRIKVFDKKGVLGGLNLTDDQFWSSVDNGQGVTDPGVEYDRLSGRWIISAVNLASSNNRVMIAVSSGSHITDKTSFTFFQFAQNIGNQDNGQFADYPQLGVDANAVYVGVNNFSGNTFTHTNVFVINKANLLAVSPTLTVTPFRNLTSGSSGPGPDSPQPATDMDPNVNEGYIVGPDNQFLDRIDVMKITNPGGSPSISGVMTVTVPSTSMPLSVPASGSHKNLDALDDRLFEAMIGRDPSDNVSLWTAHNITVDSSGVGTSGGDRDGARWYQIGSLSTTPSLVQSGTLFDTAASNPRYFWIPSIAMNGQGHASLNASMAGPGRFAEIASSGRLFSDPLGTTQPFDPAQTSSSSYDIGQQNNILRWGDYSQTVVDPNDNQTFWTFQEYANSTDSWAVRVIKLRPPPPATPSVASPSTVSNGRCSVTTQLTGTSTNGSGFFDPGSDPGGPGYSRHITASVTGGVVVNKVTYTDPTHITLDLDTRSAANGPQDVTVTNPDGQSVTATGLVTVGSGSGLNTPCLNGTSPASPANNNSPKVFGAADPGTTVQLFTSSGCGGSPVATGTATQFASSGITVSVPDNSSTTFYANETDGSNTSSCSSTLTSSPASVTYVEDSVPPVPSIDSGPTGATIDTTPTFTFSATDSVGPVTFQCSIDMGTASFGPCSGPGQSDTPFSPLPDAPYTFRVEATDAAGNSATATRSFKVDTTPPALSIDSGPTGFTADKTPTFTFSASDPTGPVVIQCSIDTGSPSFGACSGPGNADTPGTPLAVGNYTFRVQATDAVGNGSVATRSFTVKNPPDTTITKGPKKTTTKRRPKFKFTSNEPGVSFQCSLDGGPFSPCAPPFKPPKLRLGKHKLQVRAVDSSGIADPTPAVKKFKVVA